jgi:signal peptidase I
MQRTHADPAPRPDVADAGSRRPRVLPVLVVGVLVAACVRGFLVESFVVPSDALSPTVQPGERVLVWKAGPAPAPGDLVVVETAGSGDDATTPDGAAGLLSRVLGALASALGVSTSPRDDLAVVGGTDGEDVELSAPEETTVPRSDVVGVAGFRFWPLDRVGPVGGVTP